MSSYLNIILAEEGDIDNGKYLLSTSRSSELYQFFYEENLSQYGRENCSEISQPALTEALSRLKESIHEDSEKLELLHIRAMSVPYTKDNDPMQEYINFKEYVDERKRLVNDLEFILTIIENLEVIEKTSKLYSYYD